MHVCFTCNEYPPAPHGGTGSSYRDLSEGLAAAGHAVTVVGVYPYPEFGGLDEEINGVRVVRLNSCPAWFRYRLGALADRYRLTQWLRREHARRPIDIVEGSDYGGWLRFGGPRGVPVVVRIRGSNFFFDTELKRAGNPFEHGLERRALAAAHFLGAVSNYAANRTLEICGQAHRGRSILYNAVDTEVFSPSASVATEPGLITFVNWVNPKKGIEQLIDAMNLICARHPQARLVVVGQDAQKKENGLTYVERLQGRLRPEFRERVRFVGRAQRPQGVLDYLRRAQICCYPSHMETFGIAPVEAMSVGKPTIFSKTGPGPEVIEDGVSGLLCDPLSPDDIAEKICTLLGNPALAGELGRNARKRVLALFNKSEWVERNVEFFESRIAQFKNGVAE